MKETEILNVIDVETTCWEEGQKPAGQKSEIIQIGLTELSVRTLELGRTSDLKIIPVFSKISPFCTELTGLEPEECQQGMSFPYACDLLKSVFQSDKRPWASFGDFDRRMFEKCCKMHRVAYPFGTRHLNIKTLLAMAFGWPYELDLAEAMEKLGMEFEGRHHDGADDAKNIARLLAMTLQRARNDVTL